jgi:hypothetical protein
VSIAIDDVFGGREILGSHRAKGVKLGGTDPYLGPEAELITIAETG